MKKTNNILSIPYRCILDKKSVRKVIKSHPEIKSLKDEIEWDIRYDDTSDGTLLAIVFAKTFKAQPH